MPLSGEALNEQGNAITRGTKPANEAKTWSPEQIPTAADDVVLAEASGAVTISAEAKCRSLAATSYKGTLTQSANWLVGTTTSNAGLSSPSEKVGV